MALVGTVVVTGAGGFAGRHLVAHLRTLGVRVVGVHRSVVPPLNPPADASLSWARADVRDVASVSGILRQATPSAVAHLAGYAWTGRSVEEPREAVEQIVVGTLGVLEAVRRAAPGARVLLVGSADEYGAVPLSEQPLREERPLAPRTPYAAAKAAATALGLQYQRTHGIAVLPVRSFNHTGPGQRTGFVCPDLAAQVVTAEREGRGELRVGDPSVVRDFTDVRDVARAYAALLERGTPGEVLNVASGTGRTIGDVVQALVRLARVAVRVVEDPARARPRAWDCPALVGDATRLRERTGWRPEIPFERSLDDLLEEMRTRC
ncbi:MAG: GDP-mannose 4,6-dehydratase [Planctomycetales bacterium]|nr:GDP-mannose 4,6-dehydratase [Planctomycetales bacterium]